MKPKAEDQAERLLPAQRHLQLATLLARSEVVTLDDLARRFGVSTQTIRRDLARFERQGLARRTYGGAITRQALDLSEPAFVSREQTQAAQKRAIGAVAAAFLQPGTAVFLDASTTALMLARLFPDDWTGEVVVTSLPAAMELSSRPGIRLMVVGGEFRHSSRSFGGPLAEDTLRNLCVGTAFLSARAVHPRRGLTEAHIGEAALKRIIMANADRSVLLADSTKLGLTASHRFGDLADVDTLITDSAAPADIVGKLRACGPDVIIAPDLGR